MNADVIELVPTDKGIDFESDVSAICRARKRDAPERFKHIRQAVRHQVDTFALKAGPTRNDHDLGMLHAVDNLLGREPGPPLAAMVPLTRPASGTGVSIRDPEMPVCILLPMDPNEKQDFITETGASQSQADLPWYMMVPLSPPGPARQNAELPLFVVVPLGPHQPSWFKRLRVRLANAIFNKRRGTPKPVYDTLIKACARVEGYRQDCNAQAARAVPHG